MQLDLGVGTPECPIKFVATILLQNIYIREDWASFIKGLGIPHIRIEKFQCDLHYQKLTIYDIISDSLRLWVGSKGSAATLSKLFQVLDTKCGGDGSIVEESLRLEFNLPCRGAHNNPLLSWKDLSPRFQHRVVANLKKLSPSLPLNELLPSLNGSLLVNLMTGCTKSIFKETIPDGLIYYVNRMILTRNKISDEVFAQHYPDVFLFTGMDLYELISLSQNKVVRTSSEQLKRLTSKFIILDKPHHFGKICELSDKPVHLLHKVNGRIVWVKSKGTMDSLQKLIAKVQHEQSEEDFCPNLESDSNQPICISDTPGMGKSTLLVEMGRRLQSSFPDRTVVFVELPEFINQLKQNTKINNIVSSVEHTLMQLVCENDLARAILKSKLISHKGIQVELLLDGFDEVNPQDINFAFEILLTIKSSFKSIRLWITSRPHFLHELENHLSILGYTIRPFDEENQLRFLTSFWSRDKHQALNDKKLAQFAENCLKLLKSQMNSKDQDIAGIPLQCLLIGEVHEDEAISFASLSQRKAAAPTVLINSIADLYQTLIIRKFDKYLSVHIRKDFHDMDTLMNMHVQLSLQALFPDYLDKLEKSFHISTDMKEILKIGIVESSSTSGVYKFMHRTLAEYLVAWFVINKLMGGENDWTDELSHFLLDAILESKPWVYSFDGSDYEAADFVHPIITYFIDSMIPSLRLETISTEFIRRVIRTSPASSKRPVELIAWACARTDSTNIFKLFDKISLFDSHARDPLLFVALNYSGVELARLIYLLYEVHDPNGDALFSKHKLLQALLQRSEFSTVEFFVKEKGILDIIKDKRYIWDKALLQTCIVNTGERDRSDSEINRKIQVFSFLSQVNPELLEAVDENGNTPLLAHNAHVRIRIEIVRIGANIFAVDKHSYNILHQVDRFITAEGYHSLLMSISEENRRKLVQMKGRRGVTPLMRVVTSLDPIAETLVMFKNAGADFNDEDESGYSILANAVRNGRSAKTLCNLIKHGSDPNWRSSDEENILLHLAAESGNTGACGFFLKEYQIPINTENDSGHTPLDRLIRSKSKVGKRFDAGLILLERGARFQENATSGVHQTLLHLATKEANLDSVRLLLHLGVDVNAVDCLGNSLLHCITEYHLGKQYFPVIKLLLENGANPNLVNRLREVPFHTVVKNGVLEYDDVQLLKSRTDPSWTAPLAQLAKLHMIEQDKYAAEDDFTSKARLCSDPEVELELGYRDTNGNSLLHLAAEYQALRVVQVLMKKGDDFHLRNNMNQTVLHKAAIGIDPAKSFQIIKFLLDRGAFWYMGESDDQNMTFLHYYIKSKPSFYDFRQMVRYLTGKKYCSLFEIKGGDDLCTPLQLAVRLMENPCQQSLSLLHDSGVNFDVADKYGRSLFTYAIMGKQNPELLSFLCGLGADRMAVDKQWNNLLHIAARYGTLESVKYFIDLEELNVNAINSDGNTPLHCSVLNEEKSDSLTKCRLLVEKGADVTITNKGGDIPLAVALKMHKKKNEEFMEMLTCQKYPLPTRECECHLLTKWR